MALKRTFDPLYNGNPLRGLLANREYSDKMQLKTVFHQGLHCLPRLNQNSQKEINLSWKLLPVSLVHCIYWGVTACDPSIYAMNHHSSLVYNSRWKNPSEYKSLKWWMREYLQLYAIKLNLSGPLWLLFQNHQSFSYWRTEDCGSSIESTRSIKEEEIDMCLAK